RRQHRCLRQGRPYSAKTAKREHTRSGGGALQKMASTDVMQRHVAELTVYLCLTHSLSHKIGLEAVDAAPFKRSGGHAFLGFSQRFVLLGYHKPSTPAPKCPTTYRPRQGL